MWQPNSISVILQTNTFFVNDYPLITILPTFRQVDVIYKIFLLIMLINFKFNAMSQISNIFATMYIENFH